MADLDIEALSKLEAEATPGPWHREMLELTPGGPMTLGIGSEARAVCIVNGIVESPVGLRDVAFMTALRNAAPALLDAARRLAELESALDRAEARAELHRLAAEELALFPDAAKWIEGPPPGRGNYWVLMWLLNPGEWAVRLVEISPAVLNPGGQLLLKMSTGAAFQYEPNKYAIARHKPVRMPEMPLDLPPPPAPDGATNTDERSENG